MIGLARPASPVSACSAASPSRASHPRDDASSGAPKRARRMRFSRSKGGCQSCKKTKKKCDQGRPVCERCKAGDRECVYFSTSDTLEQGQPASEPLQDAISHVDYDVSAYIHDTPPQRTFAVPTTVPFPHYHDSLVESLGLSGGIIPDRSLSIADTGSDACIQGPIAPQSANTLPAQLNTADEFTPFDIDDTFLQAFLGASSFISFEGEGLPRDPSPPGICPASDTRPIVPDAVSQYIQTSHALHSVPIDCDSSLWSSFVDSTLWNTRESPDGDNGQLMDYFKNIAATTVVVSNGASELWPFASVRFYTELANMATEKGYSALTHSVMCVSAQHLANWTKKTGDMQKFVAYNELAVQHRSKALNSLRVASVDQSTKDEAIAPAVLLMLVLSANLKGEVEVVSSLLERGSVLLKRIEGPSTFPFLPTISAIHSVYTGFHSLGSNRQLDLNGLFPHLDQGTIWADQAKDACQQIYGISVSVLKLLLRCDSLVKQSNTVQQALDRAPNDEELLMMVMEITSEASGVRTDLSDLELFTIKYNSGSSERLILRHEFYRLACMLMLLRGVFKTSRDTPRVQSLVTDMLSKTSLCTAGTEIGLLWPFIIVGSEADDTSRQSCIDFVHRCQWKGSGGPRHAEAIIKEVWIRRDKGMESSWREVAVELGSPLII